MSISSPQTGGNRRPSSKPAAGAKPGAKSTGAKSSAARSTGASAKPAAGAKPGAKATGKPGAKGGNRPPVTPVKVSAGTNWGPIILFTVVGLLAVGIISFGVYQVVKSDETWRDKADGISGIVDFSKSDPDLVKSGQHQWGQLKYKQSPPVAGPHNYNWQRCQGDVYPAAIANEHAVHAMEHGAVWITYRPDLPAAQVDKLASKVRGNDFMFMSPYPGLDKAVSLQAWGFQLKVGSVDDSRIDEFIRDLRQNATQEPQASCGSGSANFITSTGTVPHDLGSPAPSAKS